MKTRTKKCGVFAALAAVLLVSAALVTSCPEALSFGGLKAPADPYANFVPPEGKGFIRFSIEDKTQGRGARTAIPAASYVSYGDFEAVSVTLVSTSGLNDDIITDWDGGPIAAVPDTYAITVTGFNNDTTPVAVAMGTKTGVIVSANVGTPATVDMKEIADGTGNGTFSWKLDNTLGVTTATMRIVNLSSGAEATYATTGAFSVLGARLEDEVSLKSGYYRMELYLAKANYKSATLLDVLHIWNGHETEYNGGVTKVLSLNSNLHRITYNYNDGRITTPYSTFKDFTHGAALTHPTGVTTPEYLDDNDDPVPAQIFQGWYTTAGAGDLWAVGTKLVLGPKALYAHWGSAPPFQGITLTLDFDYDENDKVTGFTVMNGSTEVIPGTTTISQGSPPTLAFTVTTDGVGSNYTWFYANEGATTLTPITVTTQNGADTATLTINLASDVEYLIQGGQTFSVEVYVGGIPYMGSVTIDIVE